MVFYSIHALFKSVTTSLHCHHQIHALVNCTVDVIGTSGIEWANGRGVTWLHVDTDGWRTWFCPWSLCRTLPHTIDNVMVHTRRIHEVNFLALANGYRWLNKDGGT